MIALYIFIIILCILFSLLIFVLFIPFGYKIDAVSLVEKNIRINIYWLFGLIGFMGFYDINSGFVSSINIFGYLKKIKKTQKKMEEKVKKKKKKKWSPNNVSFNGVRHLLQSIKKAIRHILPNKIEGYGRFGFNDPYYTFFAVLIAETIRNLHMYDIKLDFVFDEEIYEGKIRIKGRIFIIYLVYTVAKLYLNKSTRKLVLG